MGRNKARSKVSVNNRKTKLNELAKTLVKERDAQDKSVYKLQKQKEKYARLRRAAMVRSHKMPYYANQHVLLVGEANCSFARALVRGYRKRIAMCDSFKEMRHKARQSKGVEAVPLSDDEVDEDEDESDGEDEDENEDAMDDDEAEDEEEDMVDEDEDEADEDEDEDDDDSEDDVSKRSKLANSAAARARRLARDSRMLMTHATCGKNLLVTCYDSLEESLAKYPDLPEVLSELHSAGARVVFGVDATNLVATLSGAGLVPKERFDRIVFNFPHVGSGETDKEKSIAENQELLLRFLSQTIGLLRKPKNAPAALAASGAAPLLPTTGRASHGDGDDDDDDDEFLSRAQVGKFFDARDAAVASRVMDLAARGKDTGVTDAIAAATEGRKGVHKTIKIDRGGEVHITLKTGHPYDRWRPTILARALNDSQAAAQEAKEEATHSTPGALWNRFPRLALTRCLPFLHEAYNGYSHRRTLGFKHGVEANEDIMKADGSRTWMFTRALPGMTQGLEEDNERTKGPTATLPVRTEKRVKNKMFKRRGKNKVSRRGW